MELLYKIEFDICGVILHIIMLFILDKLYSKSKTNRLFKRLLAVCLCSGVFDIVSAIAISYGQMIPCWLNIILSTIYLLFASWAAFEMYIYTYTCIGYRPKIDWVVSSMVFHLYVLLLIINAFTGVIFGFSEGQYVHGPLFLLNYLVPIYYVLHLIFLLVFRPKVFSLKQQSLHGFILLFPAAAVPLQILFPEYLLTFFAYSLITLIMLFSLETPDFEELEYLRHNLEKEVEKQTATANKRRDQIQQMSIEMVESLAEAIDEKDSYTNGHSRRVARYSVQIGECLGWDAEKINRLRRAALLHDIGKIGIPDEVLQKPEELTDEEFNVIKSHATRGCKILSKISSLSEEAVAAKYHHEWWDGTGYPDGLCGREIPEFARIIALADSFDAMDTKRVYRDRLPRDEIRRRLIQGRATQFDPELLDLVLYFMDTNLI